MFFISYTQRAKACVACKKEFTQEDDIVFCPECGAPHHRDCWKEQGHCFYEQAHGTDLQWHPKEEPEPQPEQAPPASEEPVLFINGIAMTRCPNCKRMTPCSTEDTLCRSCGAPIKGRAIPFGNTGAPAAEPFDPAEPIDDAPSGKWAQVVMQKRQYYLPRFKQLKNQGGKRVSWNWAAFFLAPYWLAFRKCYLWAVMASIFDLIAALVMAPMTTQIANYMNAHPTADYGTVLQYFSDPGHLAAGVLLLSQLGMLILILRAVFFGLFGNYIYKKECARRIRKLDAMDPEEAKTMVFRMGGVNILMPLVFYYAVQILQNLLIRLL